MTTVPEKSTEKITTTPEIPEQIGLGPDFIIYLHNRDPMAPHVTVDITVTTYPFDHDSDPTLT